jgi:hypothetical protein
MLEPKVKPCFGFVLHFGYVEDSQVSVLVIRHCAGTGFDTVEAGARDLACYFLTDYLYNINHYNKYAKPDCQKAAPTLEDFRGHLRDLGRGVTDGWCGSWANCEHWWPWDSLRELYPYLESFWENDMGDRDGAEVLLPRYLNIEEDVPAEWETFREELRQDRAGHAAWLQELEIPSTPDFFRLGA